MSPTFLATAAFLCATLCMWMVSVALDPKTWRLRWLDFVCVLDSDTPRPERHAQENQIRIMALLLGLMLVTLTLSCAYWTLDQLRESKREKTSVEREIEYTRREAENIRR